MAGELWLIRLRGSVAFGWAELALFDAERCWASVDCFGLCWNTVGYRLRRFAGVVYPEGAMMTYPVRTTAPLMAGNIVLAAYVGLCGFILAMFFIVFALGDYRLSRTDPQLAEVMQKSTQQHESVMENGELHIWVVNWVDLKLVKDAGQAVKFGLTPTDASFAKLTLGQRVLVRFNRSNPLSSVLDSDFNAGASGGAGSSLASWAILTLMGSFFLIAWGRAEARRWISTRDHGDERTAVVTAHETSMWRGGRGTIGISAVWRDENERLGRTFWTQVTPGNPVKNLPSVGETIRVYVGVLAPDRSVWEGDVGTRLGPRQSVSR